MPAIPAVQADARGTLLSYTEEHITQLIREAVQVQHHCKRARFHLSTEKDAKSSASSSAAATKTKSRVGILRRRLHADDINMALQWRGSEKIYATGIVGGGGVANSSSRDDKKVMLEDYLKSEIKIRPPQEVGLTLHWLAVDGVQPNIPQNPGGVGTSTSNANALKRKHPLVHRVEEDADEEDASGGDGVQVTQLLPRLLSEELRLYFSRITGAVERGGATPIKRQQQDTALASLTQDPGLQELIPFMINYVTKNLYKHLGNPEHCRTLIRMAQALLVNPHIHLELYVSEQSKRTETPKQKFSNFHSQLTLFR